MVSRVVSKDIFKLFKKDSPVRNHHIYLSFGGLMIGLIGAILLAILRSIIGDGAGEFMGYYLGGAGIIAGIVLLLVKGKALQTK